MKIRDRQECERLLREAGLKKTGSRVAVLDVLERAASPMSHGEVADALTKEGFDQATVYRNLISLTEAGLARRTDLGDRVWRFERRRAGDHDRTHPHFVCVDCGVVACLPAGVVRIERGKLGAAAAASRSLEVQLRGTCAACVPS